MQPLIKFALPQVKNNIFALWHLQLWFASQEGKLIIFFPFFVVFCDFSIKRRFEMQSAVAALLPLTDLRLTLTELFNCYAAKRLKQQLLGVAQTASATWWYISLAVT